MANYYFLFSEEILCPSKEARDWLLQEIETDDSEGPLCQTESYDEKAGHSIIIYSFDIDDAPCNFEKLTNVIQEYLKKFDPLGHITIRWAETCSKARPGEFGGGLVVIGSGGQKWFDGFKWAQEAIAELDKERINGGR